MFDVQINDRGQITIPKELREKANLNPKDNLLLELDDQGRLVLAKKDIFKDLEDLIKKDLLSQGYTEKDFTIMIPERKKELAHALLAMVNDAEKQIYSK